MITGMAPAPLCVVVRPPVEIAPLPPICAT
jgi:hypothetical protein